MFKEINFVAKDENPDAVMIRVGKP